MTRSSGKLASRSNARTMVPFFSRSTISSPRRKISTSLLFNRNCLGSRTAWLFPDRNTRAVPMPTSTMYIREVYTQFPLVFKSWRGPPLLGRPLREAPLHRSDRADREQIPLPQRDPADRLLAATAQGTLVT